MLSLCSLQICSQIATALHGFQVMPVESQGFGKFSSICVLLTITSKRGYVKIFNSPHNCMGTLRPLITETILSYTVLQKYARIALKQNLLRSITLDIITRLLDNAVFVCIRVVERFSKDFSEVRGLRS